MPPDPLEICCLLHLWVLATALNMYTLGPVNRAQHIREGRAWSFTLNPNSMIIFAGKKKSVPWLNGVGRLTGSDSLDTLVHVEAVKDSDSPKPLMVIVQDFTPCVKDELAVTRGQMVRFLFQENNWMYVERVDRQAKGFVPYTYCLPLRKELPPELPTVDEDPNRHTNSSQSPSHSDHQCADSLSNRTADASFQSKSDDQDLKKRAETNSPVYQNCLNGIKGLLNSPDECCSSETRSSNSFSKRNLGKYIVLFNFWSEDENDLCVQRGEFVTLLNNDDPDWFWVSKKSRTSKSAHQEGFVPSNYVSPSIVSDVTGEFRKWLKKSNGGTLTYLFFCSIHSS